MLFRSHEKTGWDPAQILERVGTRVTTIGAKGVRIARRGEPTVEVGVVPARTIAEPTGVGDAFRAGFLTATGGVLAWSGQRRSAPCSRPASSRRSAPRSTS